MSESPLNGSTQRDPENGGKQGSVGFRERIAHFTWAWFECTMSTGAIAVLLSQQPNNFRGLEAIGKIFFILDIVLFFSFSILITIRFVQNPWALTRSLHHQHEVSNSICHDS